MKKFMVLVATLFLLCSVNSSLAALEPPVVSSSIDGLDITINWTSVPEATGYTLYYAPVTDTGPGTISSKNMGVNTTFNYTLWDGASFYLAVKAYNDQESSPYSNIEVVTIEVAPVPPTAPVLSATTTSLNLSLSWAAAPDATGYILSYAPSSSYTGPESFITKDMGGETKFSAVLAVGAAFTVAVQAYNEQGNSGYSNIERFTIDLPLSNDIDNDGDGYTENQGDCNDYDANIGQLSFTYHDQHLLYISQKVPACSGKDVFTQSPINANYIDYIEPLGHLGGHTLPVDHNYFVGQRESYPSDEVDIVAPANMTISSVTKVTMTNVDGTREDYTLSAFACSDVMVEFQHISKLTDELTSLLDSFEGQCFSEDFGDLLYTRCENKVEIPVRAGEKIGVMSVEQTDLGKGPESYWALDVFTYDTRICLPFVSPEKWAWSILSPTTNVCFTDYLSGPDAESLINLFGDGVNQRATEPVCGSHMQDLAGTAQGRWFNLDPSQDGRESSHIALAHDHVLPTVPVFSIGDQVQTLPNGVYPFHLKESGNINIDFSRVSADGNVYCYESFETPYDIWRYTGNPTLSEINKRILIEMPNEKELLIAGVEGSSCQADETMPPDATLFVR